MNDFGAVHRTEVAEELLIGGKDVSGATMFLDYGVDSTKKIYK